jgi:hypothetical protein
MRALALAALAALATLAAPAAAAAAPTVEVRARTVIELDPIKRTGDGVIIAGRLTDRSTPEPVTRARVHIRLDADQTTVQTDSLGWFAVLLEAGEGSHDLEVSFAGDAQYDPATEELRDFDVADEPLDLTLAARALDGGGAELTLHASSGGSPVGVRTVLYLGDVADLSLRRAPAALVTDASGRGIARVSREDLGGFGRKRAEARFSGDETYDPAVASVSFDLDAATAIELTVEETELAFEDRLRAGGVATDETGAPQSGQRVALLADGREVAETTTDAEGRFTFELEVAELDAGEHQIHAALHPNASWLAPARSKRIPITVGQQRPVPVAATLAAFGATCAALLAFIGLRTRPWERWLARLRRQEPSERPAEAGAERAVTGLSPARPSLVSTLRRAHDFGFTGGVHDAVTGRFIAGARVVIEGAQLHQARCDNRGAFAFEELEIGAWQVQVRAAGYVSESFAIEVPHRGELRGSRVDMLAVRERIFEMYGEVAASRLPSADLWGVWTPRQILDHVRRGRPAPALGRLTDYIEEVYFSQRAPDEDALEDAARRIDEVRGEALI